MTRVQMGNGLKADLHEFTITPQGTALLIAYDTVSRPEGRVTQAVVQEVEIGTGLVRFEWHSVGHIATSESYRARPEGRAAGTTSTSTRSRSTRTATSSSPPARPTPSTRSRGSPATILWRLGGRKSNFRIGPARSSRSSTTPASNPTARSRCSTTAPTRPSASTRARSL